MPHAATTRHAASGLMLPGLLLIALLGVVGFQTELLSMPFAADASLRPETVAIAPRAYSYRQSGDFLRGTASIDRPLVEVAMPAPIEIMKYQVSAADYGRCVAEGACQRAEPRRRGEGNVAATGVSFDDATDYAKWLSGRTGDTWRLPTVGEWSFAAGNKAADHALGFETDAANPAERWLAFSSAKLHWAPTRSPPPSRSAVSASTNSASPIFRPASGSGLRPATAALRWTLPTKRCRTLNRAGRAISRAGIAP